MFCFIKTNKTKVIRFCYCFQLSICVNVITAMLHKSDSHFQTWLVDFMQVCALHILLHCLGHRWCTNAAALKFKEPLRRPMHTKTTSKYTLQAWNTHKLYVFHWSCWAGKPLLSDLINFRMTVKPTAVSEQLENRFRTKGKTHLSGTSLSKIYTKLQWNV